MNSWTGSQLRLWEGSPALFPTFLRPFSVTEQTVKEREVEDAIQSALRRKAEFRTLSEDDKASLKSRIRGAIVRQLSTAGEPGNKKFLEECERTAEDFVREAHEFDPALSDDDVHQALRNQWVFNSFQQLLGTPLTLTPSSFAYSLLYPYTDNILDRNHRGTTEVVEFLDWITSRLGGELLPSRDPQTIPVGRLIAKVENEFSRSQFPDVFGGLLAIHTAQQKSLTLLSPIKPIPWSTVLDISFEKGGTSVLADGYLIRGVMSEEQASGSFAYGVALQLIDDLQDIKEDMAAHHSSMFTLEAMVRPLDSMTNQLLHYVHSSVVPLLSRLHGDAPRFAALIEQSCVYLILEAVARNGSFYSPGYLVRIEPFMPLRMAYLADAREKVAKKLPLPEVFDRKEARVA